MTHSNLDHQCIIISPAQDMVVVNLAFNFYQYKHSNPLTLGPSLRPSGENQVQDAAVR